MESLETWSELFSKSLQSLGRNILESIPTLLGILFIFLFGWLFAKLVYFIVIKFLKTINFDAKAEKIKASEILEKANLTLTTSQFLGKFVYWIVLLLVFMTASDALGWDAVSKELSRLISYLPKIFIALVIIVIGSYIAGFIRDIILGATSSIGLSSGKILASLVYYFLIIIITLTALGQAGIDTSIISSNLFIIIGTLFIAGALSYGFASRDILRNILASYNSKNTYKEGMKIVLENEEGIIEHISSSNFKIRLADGNILIIPSSYFTNSRVKIIELEK